MSELPAQPNRSVIEGIEVLLAVAQAGRRVRVRALARDLGMTPTRAQRYLATLAHLGLARRNGDRSYSVGSGMHALSALSLTASGLAGRAMQVLPGLGDLNAIVAVGVLWRRTVSYLYFSQPGTSTTEALGRTEGYPAEESSIGLLLLALDRSGHVERFFASEGEALREKLAEVSRQGYALIERPGGERSLAVAIGNPPFAGLAVSGRIEDAALSAVLRRMEAAAENLEGGKGKL